MPTVFADPSGLDSIGSADLEWFSFSSEWNSWRYKWRLTGSGSINKHVPDWRFIDRAAFPNPSSEAIHETAIFDIFIGDDNESDTTIDWESADSGWPDWHPGLRSTAESRVEGRLDIMGPSSKARTKVVYEDVEVPACSVTTVELYQKVSERSMKVEGSVGHFGWGGIVGTGSDVGRWQIDLTYTARQTWDHFLEDVEFRTETKALKD